jgi:hypothetical protein
VIAWLDDARRMILAGGEFDHPMAENAIKVVKTAKKVAWTEYSAILHALNTDRGSQFYANKKAKNGALGISKFQQLIEKGRNKAHII